MASPILRNRNFTLNAESVKGEYRFNHSTPRRFLQQYPSITRVKYHDTCSTGGDWFGYFVQKMGDYYYLILFSQSVLFWEIELYTGEVICRSNYEMDEEEILQIVDDYMEQPIY